MTEKALRLKKRPFASKILAAVYFGPCRRASDATLERARHTLQNLFMENGFIAGPWELGACPFRPPDAPSRALPSDERRLRPRRVTS